MSKQEILVALTEDGSKALGNIWRITAKKTDFYLDPHGGGDVMHLSAHGPNERFEGHRFHIKVDRNAVSRARDAGQFVAHEMPRRGFAFDGTRISEGAYLVARLRWTWHMQKVRYRTAALAGTTFALKENQRGVTSSAKLNANSAWDVDLVVAYGQPFWPHARESLRDDARLGELSNDSGMYLTATSYHRPMNRYPAPIALMPRLPRPSETPNRILASGPGHQGSEDFFWCVETITAREILEATDARRVATQ